MFTLHFHVLTLMSSGEPGFTQSRANQASSCQCRYLVRADNHAWWKHVNTSTLHIVRYHTSTATHRHFSKTLLQTVPYFDNGAVIIDQWMFRTVTFINLGKCCKSVHIPKYWLSTRYFSSRHCYLLPWLCGRAYTAISQKFCYYQHASRLLWATLWGKEEMLMCVYPSPCSIPLKLFVDDVCLSMNTNGFWYRQRATMVTATNFTKEFCGRDIFFL